MALAGLWPLLRVIGFRCWSDLGYVRAPAWWRQVVAGYILGLATFTLMIAVLAAFGSQPLAFTKTSGQLLGAGVKFFFIGVTVAVIEETLFRGALQGALQRHMNAVAAIVLASVVYSALHFLKPNGVNIPADQVTWASGGRCLVWIVTQSLVQKDVLVGFVSLFLAGCVLGLAYARTKALYLSIGLHAGWVLVNEFMRWSAAVDVTKNMASWPMLVVLLVLMVWLCQTTFKPLRDPAGLSSSGPGAR